MVYRIPNGLEIHEFSLDNGLKAVVVPNHFAPVLTYRTVFNVGSKDEKSGKRGIAHLFEHMMFRETKHLKNGEFDLRVTHMGGSHLNAYTSPDNTVYLQSIPSMFLDEMAELEADRMRNLIVTQEKLDAERGAVLGELHMYLNNPSAFFFKTLNELAYEKHPYKHDVIGTEEEIKSFTVKDCLAFYEHFYAPNNATVVLVGDVTVDQAKAVLQKHYGHIKPLSIQRPKIPAEPNQTQQHVAHKTHPFASQVDMGLAVKLQDIEESDLLYFWILDALMDEAEFTPAYQHFIKTGLGTYVRGNLDLNPKGNPKAFYLNVTLAPTTSPDQVVQETLKMYVALATTPLSQEKVQMVSNSIKLQYFATSNERLSEFIISGLSYQNEPAAMYRLFYDQFLKMTFQPKRFMELIAKYFHPNRMTFLFLSPASQAQTNQAQKSSRQ